MHNASEAEGLQMATVTVGAVVVRVRVPSLEPGGRPVALKSASAVERMVWVLGDNTVHERMRAGAQVLNRAGAVSHHSIVMVAGVRVEHGTAVVTFLLAKIG
jgi:hypothetical protein